MLEYLQEREEGEMCLLTYALIEDANNLELFEQIYKKYRAGMYRVAYGILHDVQLAEDAVSESLIKIAKNVEKISNINCNTTRDYIVIIVKNASIDIYRRRDENTTPIDFIEQVPASLTTEDIAVGRVGYADVMDAIKKMPEKYRDVLKLRCLYGHNAEETGRLLGIPTNTVNQQTARARKKLLELLRKEEALDEKR